MSLYQLDTLDDVLDIIMELPVEDTRGVNMRVVRSLQEMVYNKQKDTKGDYVSASV